MARMKQLSDDVIIDYYNNKQYLDGLLLSDGSLWIRHNRRAVSPQYSQVCIHNEWIKEISKFFFSTGVHNGVHCTVPKKRDRGIEKPLYHIETCIYPEFWWFYNRWYEPHWDVLGKYNKIIPKDLVIDKQLVANWYMGDGSISNKKTMYDVVTFATNCFDKDSVISLSDKFDNYFDIRSSVTKRNEICITSKRYINRFIDEITDYILPCFSYKLIYKR